MLFHFHHFNQKSKLMVCEIKINTKKKKRLKWGSLGWTGSSSSLNTWSTASQSEQLHTHSQCCSMQAHTGKYLHVDTHTPHTNTGVEGTIYSCVLLGHIAS